MTMEYLIAICGLSALCAGWVVLQRWIARVDPDLADSGHCGGGCCGDKFCDIARNDPWVTDSSETS